MIRRVTTVVVSVLGLSILMLAVDASAGTVRQPETPAATESTSPVPAARGTDGGGRRRGQQQAPCKPA